MWHWCLSSMKSYYLKVIHVIVVLDIYTSVVHDTKGDQFTITGSYTNSLLVFFTLNVCVVKLCIKYFKPLGT